MTINYNNSFRYSGPTNLPNQLDSYRFANFFNEAAVNQGDKIIFDEETIGRIQDYMAGKITTTTIPNGSNWHFHEKPMTTSTGTKHISPGPGVRNTTSA